MRLIHNILAGLTQKVWDHSLFALFGSPDPYFDSRRSDGLCWVATLLKTALCNPIAY